MSYLTVEPMSGAALDANVAFQGNVPLDPVPLTNVSERGQSLAHLPPGIMAPTYVIRFRASVPDKAAAQLAGKINMAKDLKSAFYYAAYICSGIMTLYCWYSCWWLGRHGKSTICVST